MPMPKSNTINELCPWSGDPVQDDSTMLYRGHLIGFCNPGCRDKFAKATTLFDGIIDAPDRETCDDSG
ncbi:MAG: glutathione S-transferase [Pseudomonadota bacterium]